MTDYLGVKRFCEKCQHGRKKWKSVYCTNENSNFNGLKVNNIVCAPCFSKPEPGEAEGDLITMIVSIPRKGATDM